MHDVISKHNTPLHAWITGKKGGAFSQLIKVREAAVITATGNDLEKLGSFTNEELEEQGFFITTVEPNLYLARKESMNFYIDYSNVTKFVRLPNLDDQAYDVPHNNFVELCEEGSINPQKNLASLFENEELFTLLVKCEKDQHVRFLKPACVIKLDDIYIHYQDVHKIEQQRFNTPNDRNNIDAIITTTLKTDLTILIRDTFPHYSGYIHKKTSAPHRLIIKIMIMMIKLALKDITWTTVKAFIEEHIVGIHDRMNLANLEEINDDYLKVSGLILDKINATKKVGDYKRIFQIK